MKVWQAVLGLTMVFISITGYASYRLGEWIKFLMTVGVIGSSACLIVLLIIAVESTSHD